MPGSALIDVAIGIVLLDLFVALFCTAIQEWIAQLFEMRAKHLQAAIKVLISGSEASNADADAVLNHPLVRMLAVKRGSRGPRDPSYVPARNFADALVSRFVPAGQTLDVAKLKAGVASLANPELKTMLTAIVDRAEASEIAVDAQVRAVLNGIEAWYDSAMDHASGWYKRKIRWFLLAIAAVFAIATNADTIQVGMLLASDSQLRASVAAMAAKTAPPDAEFASTLKSLEAQTNDQLKDRTVRGGFGSLPLGWATCHDPDPAKTGFARCYPDVSSSSLALLLKIVGLLLTAIAAALGAPFWFGLLEQLNAIRAAGPRPSKTAGG